MVCPEEMCGSCFESARTLRHPAIRDHPDRSLNLSGRTLNFAPDSCERQWSMIGWKHVECTPDPQPR